MQSDFAFILGHIPSFLAIGLLIACLFIIERLLKQKYSESPVKRHRHPLGMVLATMIVLPLIILVLPVSDTLRGQLLSLVGIIFSAAIALSSTTFIGNALAGMMLRATDKFEIGDFIQFEEHFGRVTEMGFLHIEIQTDDRNLTTIPNMNMVTSPVKVIREGGTIVFAELSLGYDAPRKRIEALLKQAAEAVELESPYVFVRSLNDFSVTYRVSGLLKEVKQLISARSALLASIQDTLHGAGVEIVSPTFMNTRAFDTGRHFIPPPERHTPPPVENGALPEELMFDKADEAESVEKLRKKLGSLEEAEKKWKEALGESSDESEKETLKKRLELIAKHKERMAEIIKIREKEHVENG